MLHNKNKILKEKGIMVTGIVDSFYIMSDGDYELKRPIIKYKSLGSDEYKYFKSKIGKNRFSKSYEEGEEVEILYLNWDGSILAKINDKKLFFYDSRMHILLGIIYFAISLIGFFTVVL
jgi:hypothetical protein